MRVIHAIKLCLMALAAASKAATAQQIRNAYATLLCHPAQEAQTNYLRMLLVLKESIRQFDDENDIVTMVYGDIKEEQWELLDREGFKIIAVDQVGSQVSDPESLRVPEDVSACYSAKLNALQLTQYERVIFLDSDMLIKQDLRFMFEGDAFVAYEGYESPLNAGLFAVSPSLQAFDEIQDIASSDSFHPYDGWRGFGPFPHWRLEGRLSDWSFWCAHTDQGILYYYFDKVLQQATILPMKQGAQLVQHFTGWSKPILHNPRDMSKSGMGTTNGNDSLEEWYNTWERVQRRLDTTVIDSAEETAIEASASHLRGRMAADPYCDPYDEVYLMLYNADSNKPIGRLPSVIDGCVRHGLSIVAMPPCKDKVKFKLLDGSGLQVFKTVEGIAPFSIAGDDGDDLHPLDLLKEPDSYTLEINPVPGGKQAFHFNVKGCQERRDD